MIQCKSRIKNRPIETVSQKQRDQEWTQWMAGLEERLRSRRQERPRSRRQERLRSRRQERLRSRRQERAGQGDMEDGAAG